MAERQKGLYSILRYAAVYDALQRIMGAHDIRERFARQYVRAKPGDRVLDIGCGPAHIFAHLPEVDYHGFEPNARYVARARRIFGGRGTFHTGYFTREQARGLGPFDIAIVSAVLHHMTDAQAHELFAVLRDIIKPGGRVVSLDGVLIERQNPIARLLIKLDRGRYVRTAEGFEALAGKSFAKVSGEVVHLAFPPYTHFYMTAQ